MAPLLEPTGQHFEMPAHDHAASTEVLSFCPFYKNVTEVVWKRRTIESLIAIKLSRDKAIGAPNWRCNYRHANLILELVRHFLQGMVMCAGGALPKEAGRWLRHLRVKRGLSQRELAHKVGAAPYTLISQIEHGRGRIPPDRYPVWADALGIDTDEFSRHLVPYCGLETCRS